MFLSCWKEIKPYYGDVNFTIFFIQRLQVINLMTYKGQEVQGSIISEGSNLVRLYCYIQYSCLYIMEVKKC